MTQMLQAAKNKKRRVEQRSKAIVSEDTAEQMFGELEKLCESEELSMKAIAAFTNENSEFLSSASVIVDARARSLLWSLCRNDKVTLDMIRLMLKTFPEAADVAQEEKEEEDFHASALIAACSNPFAGIEIIECLIKAYPEALEKQASYGDLPIHSILQRTIHHKELKTPEEQRKAKRTDGSIYSRFEFEHPPLPMDILELLVSQCPEALLQKDHNEYLPIHVLCSAETLTLEALKLLVEAAPESLNVRGGYSHETPLYRLLHSHHHAKQPDPEMVQFLVDKEPGALQMLCGRNDNSLPLHAACRHVSGETQAPIVRFLIDSYPEAINRSDNGLLPLHEACVNDKCSTLDTIKYLVEAHPQAATARTSYGIKPLDYAISRHNRDVIEYLIGYNSEIVSIPSRRGTFILHGAAKNPHLETLEYVYNLYPSAIEQPDDWGNFPLHAACAWGGTPASNLEFLVSKFPQAANKCNQNGMLPLHLLCENMSIKQTNLSIVYNAFPEAIKTPNKEGQLPFHLSCSNSETALQNVHALYPEADSMVDNKGNLPLHLAAKGYLFMNDAARFVYNLHPNHILSKNQNSEMPFHLLLCNGICEEFFDEIVEAYPEGLDIYHETLGFPLHCATSKQSRAKSEIVTKLFIKRYGSRVGRIIQLPLHVVLQDRQLGKVGPSNIVRWFLSNYGGHIRDRDRQGRTPFHLAVTAKLEEDVFDQLLEADPDAVRVQDKHGKLPLHYCLQHGDPNGVALRLLDLYPESICISDFQGYLPIHDGCRRGASPETIKQILERDLTQCLTADHSGELPLHKSCRAGDVDVTRILVTLQPLAVSVRNKEGLLPVMLLCQSSGKLKHAQSGTESLDIIWALLLMHPETVNI